MKAVAQLSVPEGDSVDWLIVEADDENDLADKVWDLKRTGTVIYTGIAYLYGKKWFGYRAQERLAKLGVRTLCIEDESDAA